MFINYIEYIIIIIIYRLCFVLDYFIWNDNKQRSSAIKLLYSLCKYRLLIWLRIQEVATMAVRYSYY